MFSTPVSAPSRVRAVVRCACRRRFAVTAAEQLSLAASGVLCGVILMLLLGTQILAWYWLLLLAAIGLGIVTFRIRARTVTSYRVAQILDRRLQLNDSISTAWFLLSQPEGSKPCLAGPQIRRAEALAAHVRPVDAFPFTGRRAWALTGALAAAGFGLFAVRYLVTNSLSLRQALIPVHFEAIVERLRDVLPAMQPGDNSSGSAGAGKRERAEAAAQKSAHRLLQTPGADQPGTPDPNGREQVRVDRESAQARSGKMSDASTGPKEEQGTGDAAQATSNDQQSGNSNNAQQASGTKELADSQTAGNQQASNGLLNRMRDALSSLLARMRQNDSAQRQAENSRSSEDKKPGEQVASNNEQGSQMQQSAANQQARQQQASQGQGQTTEKLQSSQGANASKAADKKGPDAQSGIGRQDGDKSLKEAEEQKAMGKLADIIGKRSASVTGDMTVETGSGKQQLQTRFTGRMGVHTDTGGEINRDDIPVEFQPYVRAYMEQIRKQQTKTQ